MLRKANETHILSRFASGVEGGKEKIKERDVSVYRFLNNSDLIELWAERSREDSEATPLFLLRPFHARLTESGRMSFRYVYRQYAETQG